MTMLASGSSGLVDSDVVRRLTARGADVRAFGDDLEAQEQGILQVMPCWMVHDMRLMIQHFRTDGMSVDAGTHAEFRWMLGGPLRSYRQFAEETAAQWRAGS